MYHNSTLYEMRQRFERGVTATDQTTTRAVAGRSVTQTAAAAVAMTAAPVAVVMAVSYPQIAAVVVVTVATMVTTAKWFTASRESGEGAQRRGSDDDTQGTAPCPGC